MPIIVEDAASRKKAPAFAGAHRDRETANYRRLQRKLLPYELFQHGQARLNSRGTELLIVILYLNLLDLPRIEQESAKACEEMKEGKIKKKEETKILYTNYTAR
ncbi:hypothetical protein DBV15_03405 [Temnothorax longispinosus]|uniref:Uncharacterized protein n=1 Tax=Temnothorax longispinosus TaxID=300112 RepID=A0A4S2KM52_9HYME|nr:hypothetical protein DBV15_03405 [Temnothorax longispinosus]